MEQRQRTGALTHPLTYPRCPVSLRGFTVVSHSTISLAVSLQLIGSVCMCARSFKCKLNNWKRVSDQPDCQLDELKMAKIKVNQPSIYFSIINGKVDSSLIICAVEKKLNIVCLKNDSNIKSLVNWGGAAAASGQFVGNSAWRGKKRAHSSCIAFAFN